MSETNRGPIFLSGASRSGTALLRSILNNAPDVYLAGETHYFDDLRVKLGQGDRALSPEEQTRCEDYFLALAHRPYGHSGEAKASSMEREPLQQLAKELGGTADAHFEAYCRLRAREKGAERWGDKTPRHVYRFKEILSTYPDARAICMVRDPRAVVASYRDWKNQGGFDLEQDPGHEQALEVDHQRTRRSYHPLIISLLWKGTVNAAQAAQRDFGKDRVRIQQYEELVRDSADAARGVLEWLDLPFDESMLDVPMHNSSFSRFDKAGGISTDPLERWKEKLSKGEIALVQSACGKVMQEVGYELLPVGAAPLSVSMGWASLPLAGMRALMANKQRMGNVPSYLMRRLSSVVGSAGR